MVPRLKLLGWGLLVWGLALIAMSSGIWPGFADQLSIPAGDGFTVPLMVACVGWLFAQQDGPGGANAWRRIHRVVWGLLLLLAGSVIGANLLTLAQLSARADDLYLTLTSAPVAPGTAAAFFLVGVALWATQAGTPARRKIYLACSWATTFIVLMSLTTHFLDLEMLYRVAGMNSMRLPTGIALCGICTGLWLLDDQLSVHRRADVQVHQRRISTRALMVLSLVATVASVGGFSLLRFTLEKALADNILLTAKTNATAIGDSMGQSLALAQAMASQPVLARLLATRGAEGAAPGPLPTLDALAERLKIADIQGFRLLDSQHRLISERGRFEGDQSPIFNKLQVDTQSAELRWRDGYLLRTESAVQARGQTLGYVVFEQRLALVDHLLSELRSNNESADAIICGRAHEAAHCAPSRFYSKVFDIPMLNAQGQVNLPINRALLRQAGVQIATDLRGIRVVAAYTPISNFGLGLVVKSDMSTVYAPLQGRLLGLGTLLLGTVALGAWALNVRVRPLLNRFLKEQERNSLILRNSHETFFSVGPGGDVQDWNHSAEAIFGVDARVAKGQPLGALLQALDAYGRYEGLSLDHFQSRRSGLSEITIRGPNGVPHVLEISVSRLQADPGDQIFIFARDLSERRAAEEQLRESERRLRTITDTVPALISRISASGTILFANDHCAEVYGLTAEQIVGHTIQDIRGIDVTDQLKPHVARVLRGESVKFESHTEIHGTLHYFQQAYVPDFDAGGAVQGFYSVSVDITEIKYNEHRLAQSERWLRDITDNLPVLIAYINTERNVRFINATGREWLGLAPGEPTLQPVQELMDPGNFALTKDHLDRAIEGERIHFEGTLRVKGNIRCLATDFVPDLGADGAIQGVYALSADVTALKDTQHQLTELLDRDTLTGLANRRWLNRVLPEALARGKRQRTAVALMYLDVDRFKSINDLHGHAVGDAVLVELAKRLSQCVRATDTVVRLAGDEFVILLEGLHAAQEAQQVAEKTLSIVAGAFALAQLRLQVSTSIGLAYLPVASFAWDIDEVFSQADAALYEAKRAGRCCYRMVELRPLKILPA